MVKAAWDNDNHRIHRTGTASRRSDKVITARCSWFQSYLNGTQILCLRRIMLQWAAVARISYFFSYSVRGSVVSTVVFWEHESGGGEETARAAVRHFFQSDIVWTLMSRKGKGKGKGREKPQSRSERITNGTTVAEPHPYGRVPTGGFWPPRSWMQHTALCWTKQSVSPRCV